MGYTLRFMSKIPKLLQTVSDVRKLASIVSIQPGELFKFCELEGLPKIPETEEFYFFDWDLEPITRDTGIVEIARPGVLFALYGSGITEESADTYALLIKHVASARSEVKDFLSSPEAQFEPIRHLTNDVFVSYSTTDSELARELVASLTAAGLSVFLAEKSINIGSQWESELREALRRSRVLTLLLTPNSVQSPWVLFESGAAWALGVPIAIATSYISMANLPAALPSYQSRPFETSAHRQAFVSDVVELVERSVNRKQNAWIVGDA